MSLEPSIYTEIGINYRQDINDIMLILESRYDTVTEADAVFYLLLCYEAQLSFLKTVDTKPFTLALPTLNRTIERYKERQDGFIPFSIARAHLDRAMAYREQVPPNTTGILADTQWVIDHHAGIRFAVARGLVARALLIRAQALEAIDKSASINLLTQLVVQFKADADSSVKKIVVTAEEFLRRLSTIQSP